MKLSSEEILKTFFDTYQELQDLLVLGLDKIVNNKIYLRSLERLTGILAISIKRLQKQNPNWNIPHYKTILKIKKQIIWDCQGLKFSYWRHVINNILPNVYQFLKEKSSNQNK